MPNDQKKWMWIDLYPQSSEKQISDEKSSLLSLKRHEPNARGVGPLLLAGFSVAWQAGTDPDGFTEWARNDGWFLTTVEVVIGSADSMRGYVHPKSHGSSRLLEAGPAGDTDTPSQAAEKETCATKAEAQGVDREHTSPSEILLYGLRIMAFSAKGRKSEHDGKLHTEILSRAVDCGVMSLSKALAVEALPEGDTEGGEIGVGGQEREDDSSVEKDTEA
ncbi:hypothetical protein BBP40_005697 [Aspergillus hancockii]|nr:hypothetical protein BBP40_005697 [Aspergillus hancockii]